MYFSPFTSLRYAIEAGLLASLTMAGFSSTIQAYHRNKPVTPTHTEIVTETAIPDPKDTTGEIRTDTVGILSIPTPTPTPTPKPTPKPKAAPAQNEKKSGTSQNSMDTKPKSNKNQQQTQKPAATVTQPQQPVQQQPQNAAPAAPAAPSQTYTEDDDDAAWEAQRNANSNNQQKDGALNYGGSQAGTAVW